MLTAVGTQGQGSPPEAGTCTVQEPSRLNIELCKWIWIKKDTIFQAFYNTGFGHI